MIGGHRSSNRRLFSLICLALSLGLLVAGLWPFSFQTSNNVRWIGESPGLELLQVYLPTRDSSLTDVMNNVLGAYIGARLFQAARDTLYR